MKKNIAILTTILLLATAAKAQIIIMENENSPRTTTDEWVINPLEYNGGYDDFTPLGDGIMLLAALGGAYLVGKHKNKKNK